MAVVMIERSKEDSQILGGGLDGDPQVCKILELKRGRLLLISMADLGRFNSRPENTEKT